MMSNGRIGLPHTRYDAERADAGLLGQSMWYSEAGNDNIVRLTAQSSGGVRLFIQKLPVYTYEFPSWSCLLWHISLNLP